MSTSISKAAGEGKKSPVTNLWPGDLKSPEVFIIHSIDPNYLYLNDGSLRVWVTVRLKESIASFLEDPCADNWTGKQVTLYSYKLDRVPKVVGCFRELMFILLYLCVVLVVLAGITGAILSYRTSGFTTAVLSLFGILALSAPLIAILLYGIHMLKRIKKRDRPYHVIMAIGDPSQTT